MIALACFFTFSIPYEGGRVGGCVCVCVFNDMNVSKCVSVFNDMNVCVCLMI